MTKYNSVDALCRAGIAHADAISLRRISMTLHRWHELECGDGNDYASWCITRGEKKTTSAPGVRPRQWVFEHDESGRPHLERHPRDTSAASYTRVSDRERGALKRLAAIMARYPTFQAYVQTDPRGASLYILRPGDVREGADVSSCYSNGVAVCQ